MEISRDWLLKHRAQLEENAARLRADLCATSGAIQNTDFVLARLAEPDPAPVPAQESGV